MYIYIYIYIYMYVYICLAENEKLTKLNKCLHIFTLKCARTHT